MFDVMLKIKKSPLTNAHPASVSSDRYLLLMEKTTEIESAYFRWITFWEQFMVSVHDRPHLSKAKKPAYLTSGIL